MRFVVAALAAFLALVPAAQATFPGRNGSIVHAWGCWYGDDDSCGVSFYPGEFLLLPPALGRDGHPTNMAWSPDGRRLAFDAPATSLGTGRAIYVMDADGTGLRQVGRGDRIRHNPAWSPDGRRLAFTQDNGSAGSGDVYTMTTSGGSLTRLTTSSSWEGAADWAPDGTRIAYTCRSGGRMQICLMTPSGGSKTNVTSALSLGGDVSGPSWSPSSQRLAFSAYRPATDERRVYTMPRTGGALRDVTPLDGEGRRDGRAPAYSPDGTRIAMEQWCAGAPCGGIRTVRVDGTSPIWIAGSEDGMGVDAGAWQALP